LTYGGVNLIEFFSLLIFIELSALLLHRFTFKPEPRNFLKNFLGFFALRLAEPNKFICLGWNSKRCMKANIVIEAKVKL